MAAVFAAEQCTLAGAVGVAERDAQEEAVELAFGQRVGAELVRRILRGDDEKRPRQAARFVLDRDLLLFHGFEQRALRFRPGAVDLIGQQHLREDGALVEDESLFAALEDADADEVAGHQIGGELHARKLQPERHRQRMCQRRFAHARNVFDEQVATGHETGDAVFDLRAFAYDDRANLVGQPGKLAREA